MHRDVFDIALKYGKDVFLMINYLGTDPLPKLFAMKGSITAWLNRFSFLPKDIPDRAMQLLSRCWKNIVPKRLMQYRDDYEHHLILKMSDAGISEAESYLQKFFANSTSGNYFTCSADEAKSLPVTLCCCRCSHPLPDSSSG